jgi:hypothetical protein
MVYTYIHEAKYIVLHFISKSVVIILLEIVDSLRCSFFFFFFCIIPFLLLNINTGYEDEEY